MNKKNLLFLIFFLILNNLLFSEMSHVIQKGETLYRLATVYNISVEEIIERNKIEDINSIGIGTKLIIPVQDMSTVNSLHEYTVAQGDTLFNISKKFNLPLSSIIEYNNLEDGGIISLGQVLLLPVAQSEPAVVNSNNNLKDLPEEKRESNTPYWPLDGSRKKYSGRIQGVKIEGNPGDYIKAVSTGKVIWYDSYKGIGKVVLIEGENGYDYLYGTKESLNVKMGISIKAGDRLGRLKENNTSLIFSVFKNGKPLNDISGAPR